MKKPQARRQERDDGRGFVHLRCKRGGCPWLVVILQETGELVLIIQAGKQMLPYGSGVAFEQAVIKPFVVGVVESLLLHSPLEIPIDFSHEAEPRRLFANK